MPSEILEVGIVGVLVLSGVVILYSMLSTSPYEQELALSNELTAKLTLQAFERAGLVDQIRLCYLTNVSAYCNSAEAEIQGWLSAMNWRYYRVYTPDGRVDVSQGSSERAGRASGYLILGKTLYVEVAL